MTSVLRDGGNHMMDGWGGSWLWMVLMMSAVVVGLVWLVRSFGQRGSSADTSVETLRQRFARGEIDEAEFRSARSELER